MSTEQAFRRPFDRDAAVAAVFAACRATGATLATCHAVAAWTADALAKVLDR